MKERLLSALLGIMFLLVFQPFRLPDTILQRWIAILCLATIAIFSVLITEFIVRYLFRMANDMKRGERYIKRRNIAFQVVNVLILSVCYTMYNMYVLEDKHILFDYRCFFTIIIYMVFISFIIGLYWRGQYKARFLQQQLNEMVFINGVLEERKRAAEERANARMAEPAITAQPAQEPDIADTPSNSSAAEVSSPITLLGATKESLTLLPSDLLYAESEGNYVNVHFVNQGLPRIATLRTTIRQVEEALVVPEYGLIRRCHRAFIVNLQQVKSVSYENHGMQLFLQTCHSSIPVSQTYKPEIKQLLVNPNS